MRATVERVDIVVVAVLDFGVFNGADTASTSLINKSMFLLSLHSFHAERQITPLPIRHLQLLEHLVCDWAVERHIDAFTQIGTRIVWLSCGLCCRGHSIVILITLGVRSRFPHCLIRVVNRCRPRLFMGRQNVRSFRVTAGLQTPRV